MLASEVERRQASPAAQCDDPPVVLAIDGLGALHSALSAQTDIEDHGRLVRILADGAAVGVSSVATLDRPGGVSGSMLSSFGQRWLFHLDDPTEATGLGVRAGMTPPAIPGRVVVVGTRLEGQVAVLPVPRSMAPDGRRGDGPMAIGTLPDAVDAVTLPPSTDAGDGSTALMLGIDFASLGPTRPRRPRRRARDHPRTGTQRAEHGVDPCDRGVPRRAPGRHRDRALPAAELTRAGVGCEQRS